MDKQITEGRIYTEGVNNGYNLAIKEFEKMFDKWLKNRRYNHIITEEDIERFKIQLQEMKEKHK